jgi:hypothetical protein
MGMTRTIRSPREKSVRRRRDRFDCGYDGALDGIPFDRVSTSVTINATAS